MAQVPIMIRQQYVIRQTDFPVFLSTSDCVTFGFQGGQVELCPSSDGDALTEAQSKSLVCNVTVRTTVSTGRKQLLDDLAGGRMPKGSKGPNPDSRFPEEEAAEYASWVDDEGNLRGEAPPRKYLPETLDTLLEEKSLLTFRLAEDTLRMIRWRAGLDGGPRILDLHEYWEWSEDGEHWHRVWGGGTLTISIEGRSPLRDRWRTFVEQQIDPIPEPLGHELYREAHVLLTETPRSALLTVVTAAEVGVKQCIATLTPDTEWLLENLPSPPVVSLVEHYLPKLKPISPYQGRQVCPPPKPLLDELKAAINLRNRLTHAGSELPSLESLKPKFHAVRDLLWLLDYYLGHEWAMEHLSAATIDACPPAGK